MTPEDQLAQALRAQASARGREAALHPAPRPPLGGPRAALQRQIALALAVALLAGVLLGVGIALVSLLAPGVLPTVG
ncbi:hypothetical protein [Pseudonocardia xishanensis]|uniref:Uncharacterized protein n=1 Tax=Pseudonocardia xishanensis TaxID=630995 RepID=A0ABP8RKE2_9PSEU